MSQENVCKGRCICDFSGCSDKHPARANREGRTCLCYGLRKESITVGWAWRLSRRPLVEWHLKKEAQRDDCWCSFLPFSLLSRIGPSPCMVLPVAQGGLSTPVKPNPETPLQTHPEFSLLETAEMTIFTTPVGMFTKLVQGTSLPGA